MQKTIFPWHGRDFVFLSQEGKGGLSARDQMSRTIELLSDELKGMGLSLNNAVRTRLWARDRESRSLASAVRRQTLSGEARTAGSSYIDPGRFSPDALVGLDLLALKPFKDDAQKTIEELEPVIPPPKFISYDGFVFLSGVAIPGNGLAEQVDTVIAEISASLTDARTSWEKVIRISFYLGRNQDIAELKQSFTKQVALTIPRITYSFVDGYAEEGALLEIEVTALQ